jgi:hypothetical protein
MKKHTSNLGQPYASRVKRYNEDPTDALKCRYRWAKAHAKARGVKFNLTWEQFQEMWESQSGLSAYTGMPMSLALGLGPKARSNSISIDRIEPDGIYEWGNVVFCRQAENAAKGRRTLEELAVRKPNWYHRKPNWYHIEL